VKKEHSKIAKMANFLRKAIKEVNQVAELASIPFLKKSRDDLETEKENLLKEISAIEANGTLLLPINDALKISRDTNNQSLQAIQGFFHTTNFVPFPSKDQIETMEAAAGDAVRLKQKQLNFLYLDLMNCNELIDAQLREAPEIKISALQVRVTELTESIRKLNEKLNAIRGK
jgi:hypothetical protein